MNPLGFFIFDGSRELFSIGAFTLRWDALMLLLAFIVSQQILTYIYKKEGKSDRDVRILLTYVIVFALIGARLGYVLLYEPSLFVSKPAEVLLPFSFQPKFHFTEGLSLHGGLIAVLVGIWLYSRKKRPGETFLQLLDRVS